jgi:hypothetical protein
LAFIWQAWMDDASRESLSKCLPAPDGTMLNHAVASGQLWRDDRGRRGGSFRCWLPEQKRRWRENDNGWYETRERLEAEVQRLRKSGWHPDMPVTKEEDEGNEEGETET